MARRYPDAIYRLIGRFGTSRAVSRLHPRVHRLTGGRWLFGENFGVLNVIVEMTGRRSGKVRDVPLYAFRDGSRLIVIGSNAGDDREPAWVGNLRANPDVRVRIGRDALAARARETEGEERARCWSIAAAAYPGYETYRRMTVRPIPVIVLEPAGA